MASWTTIDKEKCDGCGICALRCPFNFFKQEDEIIANTTEENCNLCGHCVSLCPTDAITHSKLDMANFGSFDGPTTFDTDTFIQFIRERRSHRRFKDKPIPREALEKLVSYHEVRREYDIKGQEKRRKLLLGGLHLEVESEA